MAKKNGGNESKGQEAIAGLRALADFFEQHPELADMAHTTHVNIWPPKEEFVNVVRQLGLVTKHAGEALFWVRKTFSRMVILDCNAEREEVCQKVLKERRVIPAKPEEYVPGKVVPAEPERVEEVFAWECPDSIFAKAKADAAEMDRVADEVNAAGQ